MLTVKIPLKIKVVCAFIYNNEKNYLKVKDILIRRLGPVDYESEPIIFDFTKYYTPEMGDGLYRRFISFKKLYPAEKLLGIKLDCIKIEKKFACHDKRTVNIDPGYINEAKFVLTTTKDFSHRIYLGKGIFAEITLQYQGKKFQDQPTTFPDYRTPKYKEILEHIRKTYRIQIQDKA